MLRAESSRDFLDANLLSQFASIEKFETVRAEKAKLDEQIQIAQKAKQEKLRLAQEKEAKRKQQEEEVVPRRSRRAKQEVFDTHSNLDDQHASNNWVISGKHTKSGKPLLSSDPHLGTGSPSFWVIQHMEFKQPNGETQYLVGSANPGVPMILIGRSKDISWGITAALTDVSDLFRESLNVKEDKYMLDGKWKDFKVISHQIKVKGGKTENFDVKYTHRGPLISSSVIKNAQVLFDNQIPIHEDLGNFSLSWGGHILGESYLDLLSGMTNAKTLFDVQTGLAQIPKWKSIPTNVVLADSSGNIGYMLLSTSPMRKNEYPHLGCRVLDGSTSDHDWLDIIDLKNLPFVLNPKKGYFLTANNRVVPENSRFDVGASMIATGRSIRISEMIEDGLSAGKKFTAQDMVEMQQDMTDVFARDLVKHIIKVVDHLDFEEHRFSKEVVSHIQSMVNELRSFNGLMVEDSIGASVYSYWQHFFYQSLLTEFTSDGHSESQRMDKDDKFWTAKKRLLLVDNYAFYDFYQKLVISVSEGKDAQKYRMVCKGKNAEKYTGLQQCEHGMARAFYDTKMHLLQFGSMREDWTYGKLHVNEYPSQPWSLTPFKPFWHREVPVGGNSNTPCVSKYSLARIAENKIIKSTHTANYKQVVDFGTDQNLMSIDTGMSGNVFSGNYFTMNKAHLAGKL